MSRRLVSSVVAFAFAILGTAIVSGQDGSVNLDGAVALITVYVQPDPDIPSEIIAAQGSGFLVDPQQGIIVTAKHIVDAKAQVTGKRRYMVSLGGHSREVQAQKFGECGDGSIDICILTIQAADVRAAGVDAVFQTLCVTPAVDDYIMGIGFPPGEFSSVVRARGYITGPRAQDQKFPSDIAIVGGMSGGPVLRDGYVIALNAGGLAANPNLTFVQALTHGFSLLQNAGVVCPRERPRSPVTLAETHSAEANSLVADRASPTVADLATTGVFASRPNAGSAASPACSEPEITVSFSNVFGPDSEPAVYQMQRTVNPTPNCRIGTYKVSMSGNVSVERFTVDQSARDSSIVLDYAVWSATNETKKIKFDIAIVQESLDLEEIIASASLGTSRQELDLGTVMETYVAVGSSPWSGSSTGTDIDDLGSMLGSGDISPSAGGPLFEFQRPLEIGDLVALAPGLEPVDGSAASASNCASRIITVDKAVPPLGGQVQSASFSDRIEADPGCKIVRVSAGANTIGHQILNEGSSAVLSYDITSTSVDPGRLTALVVVEQLPPSIDIFAADDIDAVVPPIESLVDLDFDIKF